MVYMFYVSFKKTFLTQSHEDIFLLNVQALFFLMSFTHLEMISVYGVM